MVWQLSTASDLNNLRVSLLNHNVEASAYGSFGNAAIDRPATILEFNDVRLVLHDRSTVNWDEHCFGNLQRGLLVRDEPTRPVEERGNILRYGANSK
jgi:hypothetical protein